MVVLVTVLVASLKPGLEFVVLAKEHLEGFTRDIRFRGVDELSVLLEQWLARSF